MKRKTIIVTNPDQDDFGTTSKHVREHAVDETYRYEHGWAWRAVSWVLYYVLAPIPMWVISRIYGMRLVNRSSIARAGGCYIYGTHTHFADVFIPYLLAFPKRAWIVAGPTAVSVPVVKHIVAMLGAVPLNTTVRGKANFRACLSRAVDRGGVVAIFPEEHEWPYYTGIRDFPPYSFTYPVRTSAPVIAYAVTYRKRRWLTHRPPHLTVTVSDPIEPARWQGADDPKQTLRDAVHAFMTDTVRRQGSYEWIHYELEA